MKPKGNQTGLQITQILCHSLKISYICFVICWWWLGLKVNCKLVEQAESSLIWDLTVVGWEVNYKEEFVPCDEGSYTIIVQKGKKMSANEEPVRNSFRNSEPGKIVLTVENVSNKRKRVLYRFKTKKTE